MMVSLLQDGVCTCRLASSLRIPMVCQEVSLVQGWKSPRSQKEPSSMSMRTILILLASISKPLNICRLQPID